MQFSFHFDIHKWYILKLYVYVDVYVCVWHLYYMSYRLHIRAIPMEIIWWHLWYMPRQLKRYLCKLSYYVIYWFLCKLSNFLIWVCPTVLLTVFYVNHQTILILVCPTMLLTGFYVNYTKIPIYSKYICSVIFLYLQGFEVGQHNVAWMLDKGLGITTEIDQEYFDQRYRMAFAYWYFC